MTLDCGHEATPDGFATGYATQRDSGKTVCYPCADDMQRAELDTSDKIGAYIASDGRNVTTWTGGHLMRTTWHTQAKNGWYQSDIHYWRAVDTSGRHWYGANAGNGRSITMRKTKGK